MLSINRTEEFQKLFDKKRQATLQYRPNEEVNTSNLIKHSVFHESAKSVASELQYTVEMLEQLTKRKYFNKNYKCIILLIDLYLNI